MVAETAAYAGGEEWLNQCVDYIDGNLDYAHDYITKNLPLVKTGNKPEGTYLMWLDVNAVADKIGAKKMVDEANAKKPLPTNPFTGEPVIATQGDMVSHWFAKNAYVFLESGSGFGKVGANYRAHECRHQPQDPQGGPGQHGGRVEESGLILPQRGGCPVPPRDLKSPDRAPIRALFLTGFGRALIGGTKNAQRARGCWPNWATRPSSRAMGSIIKAAAQFVERNHDMFAISGPRT